MTLPSELAPPREATADRDRVALQVRRAAEPCFGAKAWLSSSVAAALSVIDQQVVLLRVGTKSALVTLQVTDETTEEMQVHVGATTRWALAVRPGQSVTLDRLETIEIPVLTSVEVNTMPGAADDSVARAELVRRLKADAPAVGLGQAIRVPVEGQPSGLVAYVVNAEPSVGFVGEDTEIRVRIRAVADGLTTAPTGLGGLKHEVERLRNLLEISLLRPGLCDAMGIRPARGVLLSGPPGTGKTVLAKSLGIELGVAVETISGSEIVGSLRGESEANLKAKFEHAASHAPALLLIDEIDVIAPRREVAGALADARIVTQLLTLLDGLDHLPGVCVVATTNRAAALDPALRRPGRLDEEIVIGPPDESARAEILDIHTNYMALSSQAVQLLPQIAHDTEGFVGADLVHLCREAGLASLQRLSREPNRDPQVNLGDFGVALKRSRASIHRELDVGSAKSSPLPIGLDEQGGALLEFIRRRQQPQRSSDLASAILLSGPAGCGKSALVRHAAGASGSKLIHVRASSLFRRWFAESEEALEHVFEAAMGTDRAILLLEEFEGIGGRRTADAGNEAGLRMMHQFLSELDACAPTTVTVVCETSRPDLVDDGLRNSHRLHGEIVVPLPDAELRRFILREYGNPGRATQSTDEVELVVSETAGWSSARLIRWVEDEKP